MDMIKEEHTPKLVPRFCASESQEIDGRVSIPIEHTHTHEILLWFLSHLNLLRSDPFIQPECHQTTSSQKSGKHRIR